MGLAHEIGDVEWGLSHHFVISLPRAGMVNIFDAHAYLRLCKLARFANNPECAGPLAAPYLYPNASTSVQMLHAAFGMHMRSHLPAVHLASRWL